MIGRLPISITSVVLLLLVASATILVQPGSSADYYKCVDGKGKIYISNVSCPDLSEIKESKKLREISESEEEARQRLKALPLNQCLAKAHASFQARWNKVCESIGKQAGCGLPVAHGTGLEQFYRGSRDECIKFHPPR